MRAGFRVLHVDFASFLFALQVSILFQLILLTSFF